MNQHIWVKKNFRNFFSWGPPGLFLEFLFPKKYTSDMYIQSVFAGDYESAIIMCSIYAYI
jgi:hypothetical protein